MKIEFLKIAEHEFETALQWYENHQAGLGTEFENAVEDALSLIRQYPSSGSSLDGQLRHAAVLRFPYVVYYHFETDKIVVFGVFHGKRDPAKLLGRRR